MLIGGIVKKNIPICDIDDCINDPTGFGESDVRHPRTQQINKRFQGCLPSAAEYADVCN